MKPRPGGTALNNHSEIRQDRVTEHVPGAVFFLSGLFRFRGISRAAALRLYIDNNPLLFYDKSVLNCTENARGGEELLNAEAKTNEQNEPEQKPVSKGKKALRLILAGLCLLVLVPFLLYLYLYKDIDPYIVCEMTGQRPDLSPYVAEGVYVEYRMVEDAADFSTPGRKLTNLLVNGHPRLVVLELVDTTPPEAEFREMTIGMSETRTPDKFLISLKDAQPVAVRFEKEPPFGTAGTHQVTVIMTDMSGNTSKVTGPLTVRALGTDEITVEAGGSFPDPNTLLYSQADTAAYAPDIELVDLHTPGTYTAGVSVCGTVFPITVHVVDTVVPEITVRSVFIKPGEKVTAEDFIVSASDETELTFSLLTEPDYTGIDIQRVQICAEDLDGNRTVLEADLFISPLAPVSVEAQEGYLKPEMLGAEDVKILSHLRLNHAGAFKIECERDGKTFYALVTVTDTVAPKVTAKDSEAYLHVMPDPSVMIAEAVDMTDITYTFEKEPDLETEEPQLVTVLCTDEGGNVTKVSAYLTLTPDTTPPELYVPEVIYCYIGEPVSYFSTVAAVDERGGEVTIEVDNSQVNIYQEGSYPVTYTATDASGNKTVVTVKFTFMEPGVTEKAFNDAVDSLYNEIIPPGTDAKHACRIIYDWIYKNLKYRVRANKKDWKYEAWRSITYKNGDCFSFCAVARALLEKAGARVMVVTREGGYPGTHHWWLLVDVGTGYYHFDAINVGPKNYQCFMRTDEEVRKKNKLFWAFDKNKYPATPTEPFTLD